MKRVTEFCARSMARKLEVSLYTPYPVLSVAPVNAIYKGFVATLPSRVVKGGGLTPKIDLCSALSLNKPSQYCLALPSEKTTGFDILRMRSARAVLTYAGNYINPTLHWFVYASYCYSAIVDQHCSL